MPEAFQANAMLLSWNELNAGWDADVAVLVWEYQKDIVRGSSELQLDAKDTNLGMFVTSP